jgi:hypothetical protein
LRRDEQPRPSGGGDRPYHEPPPPPPPPPPDPPEKPPPSELDGAVEADFAALVIDDPT